MDCNQRLLQPPPDNFFNVQKKEYWPTGRRHAFMVCMMTYVVNAGVLDYKQKHCASPYNQRKCIRITPETDRTERNPDGFQLARVATETPGCELGAQVAPEPAKAAPQLFKLHGVAGGSRAQARAKRRRERKLRRQAERSGGAPSGR